MDINHYDSWIAKIERSISLLTELDLNDERRLIIEKHYPLFDQLRKKENNFSALKEYIIIRLKRSNKKNDFDEEIRRFYSFHGEYINQ